MYINDSDQEIKHYMSEIVSRGVKEIPDFPKEGILFRDLNPLLQDPNRLDLVMSYIVSKLNGVQFDKIVAIDARGFVYGSILANKMLKPLVLARKVGKLPGKIEIEKYEKEYGTDEISLQVGSICGGDKVLVVDDLLATGQTAHAVDLLVNKAGGKVIGFQFILELSELKGRELLGKNRVESVKIY